MAYDMNTNKYIAEYAADVRDAVASGLISAGISGVDLATAMDGKMCDVWDDLPWMTQANIRLLLGAVTVGTTQLFECTVHLKHATINYGDILVFANSREVAELKAAQYFIDIWGGTVTNVFSCSPRVIS